MFYKKLLMAYAIMFGNGLYAQTEPEPKWYDNRTNLKNSDNFGYAAGRGEGNNRKKAEVTAFYAAVDDAIIQCRALKIPEHELGELKKTIIENTHENFQMQCRHHFKRENKDTIFIVYALYRFKKDVYKDFMDKADNTKIDCDDSCFFEQRKMYYNHFTLPKNTIFRNKNLAPFGVKQLYENDLRGYVFLIAEVTVPITLHFVFKRKANRNYDRYKNQEGQTLLEHKDLYENYKKDTSASIWSPALSFVAIYALNIWCNYQTPNNISVSPTLVQSEQGNLHPGVSLCINF